MSRIPRSVSQTSTRSKKKGNVRPLDQIATHLPDQVVKADHTKQLPHQITLQGVLLFLDISGFTSLTEKYSMNAKNGTDQLTKTLNGYMYALVNEILTNDGDILQFAGDAILCLWEVGSFLKMKSTVRHCMNVAKSIQVNVGEYMTSAGIKLRVKVGIAAGEVMITFLGNEENCHIVTMGRAVTSVNAAEGFCVPGDIVISPSAWCHCSGIPAQVETCDDGKHVKLISIEIARDTAVKYEFTNTDIIGSVTQDDGGYGGGQRRRRSSLSRETESFIGKKAAKEVNENPNIQRRALTRAYDRVTIKRLRLYVSSPVLRKLDDGQPLEYLSEMRQVSILFINLLLEECTKYEETVTLQRLFEVIYKEISESGGCMNKVFMFDKGCTFLAIFGLPGYKHDNDCARALQCSEHIADQCNEIAKVVKTSVGVTTGSSYCGVMGHTQRQEYTVIGRKVNMAARLMMYYPGKVTCDNETFHHAKLNKANFTPLELKVMKGLQNVGTIREYRENKDRVSSMEYLRQQELEFPLIGRDAELSSFMAILETTKSQQELKENPQVVVVKGESGIGKSRVLDSMVVRAMELDTKVVMLNLHIIDTNTPFYAIKHLLIELLDLDMDSPRTEREHHLFSIFKEDENITHDLPLLNDLLHLKLNFSEQHQDLNDEALKIAMHNLVLNIVNLMVKTLGRIVFCADDAHYMDRESWEFITYMGKNMSTLVLLAVKSTSKSINHIPAQRVLSKSTTMTITLEGLDLQYIGALACQLLAVTHIPTRLDEILRNRSNGLPAWCEQLLYSMLYDGLLNIEPYDSEAEYPEPLVSPADNFKVHKINKDLMVPVQANMSLSHRLITEADMNMLGHHSHNSHTELLSGSDDLVCLFTDDFVMADVRLPDSIKGMIQARIDGMAEIDQMIVKTGAILGLRFPRVMLNQLLDKKIPIERVNEALARLAENGVLQCGSQECDGNNKVDVPTANLSKRLSIVEKKFVFQCYCNYVIDNKVDGCQLFGFQTASIQETAYEMYTENLRRQLHVKAAEFMEQQPHRCQACGGGKTVLVTEQVKQYQENPIHESDTKSSLNSAASMPAVMARVRKISYRASISQHTAMVYPGSIHQEMPTTVEEDGDDCETRPETSLEERSGTSFAERKRSTIIAAERITSPTGRRNTAVERHGEGMLTYSGDKLARAMRQSLIDDGRKGFMNIDLRECRCAEIMTKVFPELVRHWKYAGNVEKTINVLLEGAAALLSTDDNIRSLAFLSEISDMIEAIRLNKNPFQSDHVNYIEEFTPDYWIEGQMHSLMGQTLSNLGRLDQSLQHFHTALKLFGCPQPDTRCRINFRIMSEGLTQMRHSILPSTVRAVNTNSCQLVEMARCLSHIFQQQHTLRKKKEALMTVLQQVNFVEQAESEIYELILAYSCMMECCQLLNWPNMGERYENQAQMYCLRTAQTKDSLITIGHFYLTSLIMRLSWGKTESAIEAGYTGEKILARVHDNELRTCLLPYMCYAMIMAGRTCNAVESLEQLDYITAETSDMTGRTFYYASCMVFILEVGFQLEPIHICLAHATDAKSDRVFERNYTPLYYLACCFTLWYQRHNALHKRAVWQEVAKKTLPTNIRTPLAMHGYIMLLEMKLLEYMRFHTEANQKKIRVCRENIDKDFLKLNKIAKYLPIVKPRLLHYEAYYCMIRNERRKGMRLLKKSFKASEVNNNLLELKWATHSRSAWLDELPRRKQKSIWSVTHAYMEDEENDGGFLLEWNEAKNRETLSLFTLPLPPKRINIR